MAWCALLVLLSTSPGAAQGSAWTEETLEPDVLADAVEPGGTVDARSTERRQEQKGVVGLGAPDKAWLAEELESRAAPSVSLQFIPGALDPSFSHDGKVSAFFDLGGGRTDVGRAVAIQPDGKIVVAGFAERNGGDFDFAVLRLRPDGSLDPTFAGSGKGVYFFDFAGGTKEDFAQAVAIQPDGKIVVAGQASYISGSAFAVVRLLPNGSLDPTFSQDGKASLAFGIGSELALSLAIQPDGKIVLAGQAVDGANAQFGVARLNPNGALDTSFSGDGKQTIAFDLGGSLVDTATDVVLQPDGKIVLVGDAEQTGGSLFGGSIFAIARLLPNGNLDSTFNGDGRATFSLVQDHLVSGVALRPGGEILIAGSVWLTDSDSDFLLVQLDGNGFLDPGFGGGDGWATVPFDVGPGKLDVAHDVVLSGDGRALVVGSALVEGTNFDFAIARLDAQGLVDPTFGRVRVPFDLNFAGGLEDGAFGVALQNDSKIVVAGFAEFNRPDLDFAVLRLFGDPPLFADGFESGSTSGWSSSVP